MQEIPSKLVQLTVLSAAEKDAIARLGTEEGRDALARQIGLDIDEYTCKLFDDGPRSHLGASLIGADCDRHIAYTFRWFKHKIHSGRMQRLFQRGHDEEEKIIAWLRGIGCEVEQVGVDGHQIRIIACNGHFGGSSDGSVSLGERYGLPASLRFLIEIKTVKDGNYDKTKRVWEDQKRHWRQMCIYGRKRGFRFAIYFFVNKDDDRIHIEVVALDWELADHLEAKAGHIISSEHLPPRINNNPSFWKCKQCDHHGICHLREPIDRNCRTCTQSIPIENGQWACQGWNIIIDKAMQLQGCQNWTERPQ